MHLLHHTSVILVIGMEVPAPIRRVVAEVVTMAATTMVITDAASNVLAASPKDPIA